MTGSDTRPHSSKVSGVTQAELKCLLAILKLSEEEGRAATNKIAGELQVKPPTVCRVLDQLLAAQLITKEPYGKVELTLLGKRKACQLRSRVNALQTAVVRQLNLNAEAALHTALFIACSLDENSQKQMITHARDSMNAINLREVIM